MTRKMYVEMTEKNINPLAGRCPHECSYCYALNDPKPNMKKKYGGPLRLDEKVLASAVKGGTRFLCSCNDLFAEGHLEWQAKILDWAAAQKSVEWWLQSKNPGLMMSAIKHLTGKAGNIALGTTIETNRDTSAYSKAPPPVERFMKGLDYITIEPIMDFDHSIFYMNLKECAPRWINIGADSRPASKRDLPEPSEAKVVELVNALRADGFDVRLKPNLERLAPSLFVKSLLESESMGAIADGANSDVEADADRLVERAGTKGKERIHDDEIVPESGRAGVRGSGAGGDADRAEEDRRGGADVRNQRGLSGQRPGRERPAVVPALREEPCAGTDGMAPETRNEDERGLAGLGCGRRLPGMGGRADAPGAHDDTPGAPPRIQAHERQAVSVGLVRGPELRRAREGAERGQMAHRARARPKRDGHGGDSGLPERAGGESQLPGDSGERHALPEGRKAGSLQGAGSGRDCGARVEAGGCALLASHAPADVRAGALESLGAAADNLGRDGARRHPDHPAIPRDYVLRQGGRDEVARKVRPGAKNTKFSTSANHPALVIIENAPDGIREHGVGPVGQYADPMAAYRAAQRQYADLLISLSDSSRWGEKYVAYGRFKLATPRIMKQTRKLEGGARHHPWSPGILLKAPADQKGGGGEHDSKYSLKGPTRGRIMREGSGRHPNTTSFSISSRMHDERGAKSKQEGKPQGGGNSRTSSCAHPSQAPHITIASNPAERMHPATSAGFFPIADEASPEREARAGSWNNGIKVTLFGKGGDSI